MKRIKGFEGYSITTDGKVWSDKHQYFLTPYDNHGYKMVRLYNGSVYKDVYVHRLVAETYIPNPDNLPEVDHIDANKENNAMSNLQWMTKENNIKKAKSKKVYCVELDRVFNSQKEAANELGLDQGNISKACRGTLRTTGGYHWEFIVEG